MLVGANDGRVDEALLEIGISAQRFGDTVPYPVCFPTGEADLHRMPIAKLGRQVSLRIANTRHIWHRFDEQPVIRCLPAFVYRLPRKQMLDTFPLPVAQYSPTHRSHPNSNHVMM